MVTSLGRTIGGSCLFMCMAGIWGCLPMLDLISRASTYTFSWHDPTLSNTPCRWTDSPSDRWPGLFLLEREVPPGPTSSLACTSSSEPIPGNLFKACWNSCSKGQIWSERAFFHGKESPELCPGTALGPCSWIPVILEGCLPDTQDGAGGLALVVPVSCVLGMAPHSAFCLEF